MNNTKKKKKSRFDQMNYGALCTADMKKISGKVLYGLLVLFLIIDFAIVVIPALWMVLTGFKEPSEMIGMNQSFFPKQIRLGKVLEVWNGLKMHQYYANTLILSIGAVIADVVINGLAGYVISRLKPMGSKFYFSLVTLLMLIPGTASTVPIYMMFTNFPIIHVNMLNTFWPLWIMAAANMFNILLFKTSFDSISISLIEAAKIDGASAVKIFFNVVLPLSMPVMVTVAIFTFNANFGNFFWPYLILSEKELRTVGVALYLNRNSQAIGLDWKMMMTIFSFLPQLLVFVLFQKRIVGGINIGGVKG